jgi:hypothetical protein
MVRVHSNEVMLFFETDFANESLVTALRMPFLRASHCTQPQKIQPILTYRDSPREEAALARYCPHKYTRPAHLVAHICIHLRALSWDTGQRLCNKDRART